MRSCVNFDANNHMRFYDHRLRNFDANNRMWTQTTHPVWTYTKKLSTSKRWAAWFHGSKHVNTRLGTRTWHFIVVILDTRNSAENWHSAHPKIHALCCSMSSANSINQVDLYTTLILISKNNISVRRMSFIIIPVSFVFGNVITRIINLEAMTLEHLAVNIVLCFSRWHQKSCHFHGYRGGPPVLHTWPIMNSARLQWDAGE